MPEKLMFVFIIPLYSQSIFSLPKIKVQFKYQSAIQIFGAIEKVVIAEDFCFLIFQAPIH